MKADQRIGSTLGGYRIDSLIGRGGMSVVYLAEHLRLNRMVALKLLAPDLAEDQRFRERFVRESRMAASLEHPNIIPIYDADEVDGHLYIAMRYVEGTDLKRLLSAEGRLSPERTIAILSQVAGALDAAHARGLVHRDVKPGNILIARGSEGEEGHVYLSDFGLTKRAFSDSGLTATGQFVGTLDYAAPEQFEGKQLDGRTDQYSLGCVLYECLTGEVPFPRDQEAALMYAHLLSPVPSAREKNPELPEAIDPVLSKAMAKKPEDRYPSCGQMIGEARRALGVSTGERPTITGPAAPAWRRFLLTVGVAAVVVIVGVVAIVLATRGGGSAAPSPKPAALTSQAIERIDLSSGKVVATIRLGHPTHGQPITQNPDVPLPVQRSVAISAEGSVWVTNGDDSTVTRIDPLSNKAVTIKLPHPVWALAVGGGLVWVTSDTANELYAIDPATNKAVKQISIGTNPGPRAVAFDQVDSAVWVSGGPGPPPGFRTQLFRVDPETGNVMPFLFPATSYLTANTSGIAVGEGSVWLATESGNVIRFDPATSQVVTTIEVGGVLGSLVVDESTGSVWVTSVGSGGTVGSLVQIDAATNRVVKTLGVSCCPGYITIGQGSIWVTDSSSKKLVQISASTNDVANAYSFDTPPSAVAVGRGFLWVTVDKQSS